jgi:thiamine biosynthesis lipoprotein
MITSGYTRHRFEAMGTQCELQFQAASAAQADEFRTFVSPWIRQFEQRYSRFLPDSLVGRANAAAGREPVPTTTDDEELLALCDWFHWSTGGIFDPAALPVIELWDHHKPHHSLPADADIAAALKRCGWSRVRHGRGSLFLPADGMAIDLGGIGKEYAVDRIFEEARKRGIANVLVNFGHDLRVLGSPPEGGPWRIGLEDPADNGHCWGGVALHDRAVTTSGDYLRHFEFGGKRFGHILDPRTGLPVDNGCRSVTVIAPTCTEAGILSTTAFILGAEEGLAFLDRYYQAEGCITTATHRFCTRRFHEYIIKD